VARYKSIRCLLLNGCSSLATLTTAIAPVTVGMEADLGDAAAIEFARGFYDALGAGRTIDEAIQEGESAAELKGLGGDLPLRVLRQAVRDS